MDFRINRKQRSKSFFIIAWAVLFLDQTFKFAALKSFGGLQINRSYNSLLGLDANSYLILLSLLIVFIYFKKSILRESGKITKFAGALMFGGIMSNSADMFFYGYIIDYITIPHFFSFNISDLAIIAGAFILGWKVLEK